MVLAGLRDRSQPEGLLDATLQSPLAALLAAQREPRDSPEVIHPLGCGSNVDRRTSPHVDNRGVVTESSAIALTATIGVTTAPRETPSSAL